LKAYNNITGVNKQRGAAWTPWVVYLQELLIWHLIKKSKFYLTRYPYSNRFQRKAFSQKTVRIKSIAIADSAGAGLSYSKSGLFTHRIELKNVMSQKAFLLLQLLVMIKKALIKYNYLDIAHSF
jgi:hypothetical protein